ncbi:coronin-7 isoform X2 [Agrilus planipennis]|uniref:Coronin n=1 Tax=Agrilus planipennis TaxID=224129 RepID=A0A1W4WS59_AGRPL|nr:coronin-7 isoform X2 [Agrilus planipennis]
MAWRFKASKYKNAAPIVPKPEAYVRDICVGSYQTYGNNITASAQFMAFNWDYAGSSLAVFPINDSGRKSKLMPLLNAHSDTVTDMHFSPFHDNLLATASQDCLVKIWIIPEGGLKESLCNPECQFSHKQRRVETISFHPTSDYLIHSTSYSTFSLWDLISQKEVFSTSDHSDVIQSVSWKRNGKLVATSCKDKHVRILDPRSEKSCVSIASSHQNIKDSRIVWLGDQDKVLTTGFNAAHLRQVILRDTRNFENPLKTLELDCSTGILMPLFDSDTNMLFLAGKGDATISYMEVADKEPFLLEGLRHSGEQTKGACLVPKRALNIMQCEVNRILQLTGNAVIPVTYQVPRKSYRDFHGDLYPDTPGCKTDLVPDMWLQGEDIPVPKINLDPSVRQEEETNMPLLGPKPFTPFNMRETETFDKVFSVPTAPGRKQQNGLYQTQTTFISHEKFDSSQHAGESNDNDIHENNSDVLQEPYEVDKQIEHDSVQKKSSSKPSQVEEVKQCSKDANNEKNEDFKRNREGGNLPLSQSMSAVVDDDYDEEDSFERSSSERRSIAERRKMYENRSLSVQETSDKLPKSPLHKHTEAFKSGRQSDIKDTAQQKKGETVTTTPPKRTSTVFGRVSKFRHLKGTALHKSQHIENVRNLSRQIPGESDGFHANPTRVAVPLSGPGGKIAIFELKRTGRLPDGVIPALVHGQNVTDFCWDPFDDQRLAVACGDGTVKLWKIPDDGLKEQINEPEIEFCAHSDRIYFVKFHPLAKNVLATGAYDLTIKIWHLSDLDAKIVLLGHTEQISAFAWSPCGKFCATFSKDGLLRIFEPRQNNQPIREGKGPVGTRGGRLTWALNGRFLVVMGFDKVSVRQIMVFQSDNLSAPLNTMTLDVSPSILIPFYDEDSSTLFVTGKGDSTVYAFEITEEAPYICPLSHHRCPSLHQGLSFLPKNCCDVAKVEFAKAFRLTNNTIEPLSFTVPRIKTDLFQDDLFPSTKVSWKPALTGAEWFNGKNTPPQYISLKPEGMEQLSDSVVQETQDHKPAAKMTTTQSSFSNALWNMDKAEIKSKQAKIQQSICDRIEINMKLEQDDMEGVDEKEWEEEE